VNNNGKKIFYKREVENYGKQKIMVGNTGDGAGIRDDAYCVRQRHNVWRRRQQQV
jgi:hypothetical protein